MGTPVAATGVAVLRAAKPEPGIDYGPRGAPQALGTMSVTGQAVGPARRLTWTPIFEILAPSIVGGGG
jgi:hypothetical protein